MVFDRSVAASGAARAAYGGAACWAVGGNSVVKGGRQWSNWSVHIHLTTERMQLRRFTEADSAALAALHGIPAVMRYIDNGLPVPRAVVEGETLPGILSEYAVLPDGFGCWAAVERSTGAFLGWLAFRPPRSVGLVGRTDGAIEMGYRLDPGAEFGDVEYAVTRDAWLEIR